MRRKSRLVGECRAGSTCLAKQASPAPCLLTTVHPWDGNWTVTLCCISPRAGHLGGCLSSPGPEDQGPSGLPPAPVLLSVAKTLQHHLCTWEASTDPLNNPPGRPCVGLSGVACTAWIGRCLASSGQSALLHCSSGLLGVPFEHFQEYKPLLKGLLPTLAHHFVLRPFLQFLGYGPSTERRWASLEFRSSTKLGTHLLGAWAHQE